MNHATPTKNVIIKIHKITHHTVLSDGKTPHDFMASSPKCRVACCDHRACVRPSGHPNFHDIELCQMNERELIAREDLCATLHKEVADLGRSPSSLGFRDFLGGAKLPGGGA